MDIMTRWQPGTDAIEFPERFRRAFGRAPRILHIGNVANYAYLNTKLQRQFGIEAYCIDPNFYHIMAAPEWLEAAISGDHGNDFAPHWSRVDLGGYRRPAWFAQGNEKLVFKYIDDEASGRPTAARKLLRQLEIQRRLDCNDTPLSDDVFQRLVSSENRILRTGRQLLKRILRGRSEPASQTPVGTELTSESFEVIPPFEVMAYAANAVNFRPALERFDVIQGYTTQGIYPAVAGVPNFTSYELGTIRGLPFEDSAMGRLTRWVYLMSPEVFITNIDCLEAASRLGLSPERVNKALHAFDLDEAVAFSRAWAGQPSTSSVPEFYAPARQHWKEGNDSILKGNDVAIRGAALLKERGYRFKLILGEWGSEVDLSRQLIQELNVSDCITWCKPLPRKRLWPTYMRATAVVDQFRSPAFGGVSLESMALGRRLITGYDHRFGREYFSEPPPILNCRTSEAVADAMEQCILDPVDNAGLGKQAQTWMLREHSVARQMRDQFAVYERLLSKLRYEGRWVKRERVDA
jgi:glycosyltransferase involved in cell wall biosynthesis